MKVLIICGIVLIGLAAILYNRTNVRLRALEREQFYSQPDHNS
jgi:hypothetical protein